MHLKLIQGFLVTALAGATALAGSFTSNFSDPFQLGLWFTGSAVIENGHLVLTPAENSLQGTMIVDDLDSYQALESFTVAFKLQIGPGSGNPADGFSFSFGPDVTAGSNFGEEGGTPQQLPGTGA